MAVPPSFTYDVFDPRQQQIRLLNVFPDDNDNPLRASVHRISLSTLPVYKTISYVWGNPTRSASIDLDGKTLRIPQNTYNAIRRMRLADRPRALWIDAICINQDDLQERGQQLDLMGTIYRGSIANLIHLVDDTTQANRLCEFIEDVDKLVLNMFDGYENFGKTVRNSSNGDLKYSQNNPTPFSLDDQGSILDLLELAWFRRLWVIQKARLAAKNVCYLGETQVQLLTILKAVCWLDYVGSLNLLITDEAQVGRRCILGMFDLTDKEHGRFSWQTLTFRHLLVLAQNFEKTEPRDSVFAMLGMLPADQIGDISPNYTLPLAEVLEAATRNVLASDNHLGLLRFVNHRPGSLQGSEIASWARRADWQYSIRTDPRPLQDYFSASSGLEPPTKLRTIHSDRQVVTAEGFIVDEVKAMSSAPDTFGSETGLETWLYSAVVRLVGRVDELPDGYDTVLLASVIAAERAPSGLRATRPSIDKVATLIKFFFNLCCDCKRHLGLRLHSEDSNRPLYRSEIRERMQEHCDLSDIRNRRLFLTQSDRFGLGPQVMHEIDVVAILRGLNYPCLLRPVGPNYQFVGIVYVHGIMDGEAVLEYRRTSLEETLFNLI